MDVSLRSLPSDAKAVAKSNPYKKTKLCTFFQAGCCRFGEQCEYAHADEEIEPAADLRKTAICVAWVSRKCPHTKGACRFAHGKMDLRQVGNKAPMRQEQSAGQPGKLLTASTKADPCAFAEPMKVQLPSSFVDWKDLLPTPFPVTHSDPWDVDTTASSDFDTKSEDSVFVGRSSPMLPLQHAASPPPIRLPLPRFGW
mmetsp:Transcript_66318/g.104363  ORF Transcript_66318/g.104363 Transcript_66318/m.104363 type:complete len:198 (-) Transcript_66318:135-728(-)